MMIKKIWRLFFCGHEWKLVSRTIVKGQYDRAEFYTFFCPRCLAIKREARLGSVHHPDAGCFRYFDLGEGRRSARLDLDSYQTAMGPSSDFDCGNCAEVIPATNPGDEARRIRFSKSIDYERFNPP